MAQRPLRVLLLGLVLLAPAFAGCLGTPSSPTHAASVPSAPAVDPLAGLAAVGANATHVGSTLTWTWHAVGGSGAEDPVLATPIGQQGNRTFTFEVGPGAKQLDFSLRWNGTDLQAEGDQNMTYGFEVRNATGGVFCTAYLMKNPEACGGPLPVLAGVENWTAKVVTSAAPAGGIPFTLVATLNATALPIANLSSFEAPNVTFAVTATGGHGGEPSLGVDGSGNTYVLAGLSTLRSSDGGATWQDVSARSTRMITLDPDMTADPYTHRIFVDQLTVACSILAWSDDAGSTWNTNPAACGLPSDDHEKLAVGDAAVPSDPAFNGTVYYAFHSIGYHPAYDDVVVSRSVDGGASFTPVVAADGAKDHYIGGATGPVFADRHGNVIIAWPVYEPDGLWVAVSHDHGLTYSAEAVAMGSQYQPPSDPASFFDSAGNAYIVWAGTNHLYYVESTDGGSTWSAPHDIGPAGLRGYVYTAAKPGDPGSFAVAFYGSREAVYGPDAAPSTATWNLFEATVTNATSTTPQVHTALVSDRVLQRGGICMMGTACTGGDRNLLDFIDLALDATGHPVVTFTDGCNGCNSIAGSRNALNLFASETSGPSLYASGMAPWARPTGS